MNDFYEQPKLLLWIESLLLLIAGFLPVIFIMESGKFNPLFYLLFVLYILFSQFAFTPFFKLTGVYTYYSPMLLGYMSNDKQIDLHSGGSFDYLLVMRKYSAGVEIRYRLLMYHLEGLKNLIVLIKNRMIPETVSIVGTSYFFNDRTLQKIGFEMVKPSIFYRINLFANFIDLIWMYSLSKGEFSVPKVWNAKKAIISGSGLIENKKSIIDLYERMKLKMDR